MLHGEPEYRRRRRKKAAQDQYCADSGRDETDKKRDAVDVIAALKAIVERLERAEDEKTPKNKHERNRHWLEIAGLWIAAAVGAAAIVVGTIDAGRVRKEMHAQLLAMTTQSNIMNEQVRPRLELMSLEFGEVPTSVTITPRFQNTGIAEPYDMRGWSRAKIAHLDIPALIVGKDILNQITRDGARLSAYVRGKNKTYFPESTDPFSPEDIALYKGGDRDILAWGEVTYRDFPGAPLRTINWARFYMSPGPGMQRIWMTAPPQKNYETQD